MEGSGGRFQGLRGVVERSGGVWAQSGGRLVWHIPKPSKECGDVGSLSSCVGLAALRKGSAGV